MNRVRPVEALLAALATLAVTLPLTTLFTPSTWFRPERAARRRRRPRRDGPAPHHGQPAARRASGQVVLLVIAAAAGARPRPPLARPAARPRRPAAPSGCCSRRPSATVTNYTAPAPSNRATILAISLLIGLTAVAVDAIGVTYRSPALAGIPLLSAFLASATNSGDGLGAWYAVPGALRLARPRRPAGRALAAGLGHGIPALVVRAARRPDDRVRDARAGGRRRRPRPWPSCCPG